MTSFDFSPLFRSTVGFDRLSRLMEGTLSPHGESTYPPYNIETAGENSYRISIAVAGFGESDLDVTVRENTLTVSGKIERDEKAESERKYMHRGIAGRSFRLAFALADAVREGRVAGGPPIAGFSDPLAAPHLGAPRSGIPPVAPRNGAAGRRRGHLRVLPDPAD